MLVGWLVRSLVGSVFSLPSTATAPSPFALPCLIVISPLRQLEHSCLLVVVWRLLSPLLSFLSFPFRPPSFSLFFFDYLSQALFCHLIAAFFLSLFLPSILVVVVVVYSFSFALCCLYSNSRRIFLQLFLHFPLPVFCRLSSLSLLLLQRQLLLAPNVPILRFCVAYAAATLAICLLFTQHVCVSPVCPRFTHSRFTVNAV